MFHGLARPAAVTSGEPGTAASIITVWATSMSRRRSTASASTPLQSPKTRIGPIRARPTSPRDSAFQPGGARSAMCQRIAAPCIMVPDIDTSWPSHSRRKFRWLERDERRRSRSTAPLPRARRDLAGTPAAAGAAPPAGDHASRTIAQRSWSRQRPPTLR